MNLLTDSVVGYMFWSLYEGLAPMIWFYPLNSLEISGYEVFAVVFFSPILFISKLKKILQAQGVVTVLRLGAVIGLGSFQTTSTFQRLCTLSVGVACVSLVLCSSLWHPNVQVRNSTFWGLIIGRFIILSSRVWFTSFMPTWWNNSSNNVVIACSTIAVIHKIISGDDDVNANPKQSGSVNNSNFKEKNINKYNTVCIGVGAGSLMYVTNALYGEVSLVTRWTVRGYPDTGPQPYPWGLVILIALWFGIVLSVHTKLTNSFLWWVIGTGGFTTLYNFNTWTAFIGGVVLAVYIMSVWPEMIERVTACNPASVLSLLNLTYIMCMLFSVWTVAYNFVPGGTFTREHTGYLIGFTMLSIAAALFHTRRKEFTLESPTVFQEGKMSNSVHLMIFVAVIWGVGGFAYRYPNQSVSHPEIKQPKADFSAAIWTYHFGYNNEGWPSLERTVQLLNDTGADVITLLESDASKPFLGNNDLGMYLGEKLNMYVDFGVSTKDHTWGNLLLSKYPIIKSIPIMLPSPHGELAPAISATVNMSGHLVDFVVTHMGNDRDRLDRKLQSQELAKELKNAENPVVFLGYVTSYPGSDEYYTLIGQGNVKDIDHTDLDRWCEYIMYRGLIRLGYARISNGRLSDTELQMARFRIPRKNHKLKDNNKVEVDATRLKERFRFNPRFGKFNIGHNWWDEDKNMYHMSTPKYFVT